MPSSRHRFARARALSSLCVLLLAACSAPGALRAFASDGCSMFPDRAPVGRADWCDCCLAHDLAYWRGGSAEERLEADRALQRCVHTATGDALLAEAMLAGVRAGGGPYFPTGYRWGYGWPYGRAYAPLSAGEEAQAARLRERYLAGQHDAVCRAPSAPAS